MYVLADDIQTTELSQTRVITDLVVIRLFYVRHSDKLFLLLLCICLHCIPFTALMHTLRNISATSFLCIYGHKENAFKGGEFP